MAEETLDGMVGSSKNGALPGVVENDTTGMVYVVCNVTRCVNISFLVSLIDYWICGVAYTMFNVFLPKLLETRKGKDNPQTLQQSLWEVLLFTLGGCPGSFVCSSCSPDI